jgi:DNA polymerase
MSLQERARLNSALKQLTDGTIIQRIRTAVNSHGHEMTTLDKKSVSAMLAGKPCEHVRRLLELRREGARASTQKYKRIFACMSDDDRMRGMMRFHGSSTGRWSGRGP